MTTKAWTAWYDEVLPDVPGCPQAVAKNAIRNAAIDFCERSLIWRADMEPISAVANQAEYDFEPEAGAAVVKVVRLWYDKKEIYPQTPEQLAERYAHWPSQAGTPLYYTQERPDAVILVPYPNADLAGALTGKLALKPTRASTAGPAFLFEEWLEAIACGAKARLFAMKKKPWTDGELAGHHQAMFDHAIAKTMRRASQGHTRAPLRVRAHFL
ncbi:MAG TPA: hypothetical protein VNM24_11325 [Burkholderiales bacterium]|nr:hypothetical protein [Burkholderiales bacterium]